MPTPARRAAANSAGEHSLCPTETTTASPRHERRDQVERPVHPGRASPSHACARGPRIDLAGAGQPIQRRSWAPGRWVRSPGPSKCSPSGVAAERRCGRRRSPRSNPAPPIAASGAVTIVGRKAVTPVLGSRRATSPIDCGSVVKSWPQPPLSCRSMNPGATYMPATSTTDRRPPAADRTLDDRSICNGHVERLGGAVRRDDLPAGEAQRAAGHSHRLLLPGTPVERNGRPERTDLDAGGEVISRRLSPIEARNGDRCSRSASAAAIGSIRRRPSPIPTPPPITIRSTSSISSIAWQHHGERGHGVVADGDRPAWPASAADHSRPLAPRCRRRASAASAPGRRRRSRCIRPGRTGTARRRVGAGCARSRRRRREPSRSRRRSRTPPPARSRCSGRRGSIRPPRPSRT